jgi:flagellar biosynthesis/type III secretory pathway chaperone
MMKIGSAKYLDLVERRLQLLREIFRLGAEWRTAFIGLKMEESERCAIEEELLCQQIRKLDNQIAAFGPAPSADPVAGARIAAVLNKMASLQQDLKQANETRRAILKRSLLTMNALRNLFNSYAPLYSAPAAASTGTLYEESV